jgi:hypothetical protein
MDPASAAALKRKEIMRATYRDGFSHRLLLAEKLPPMPMEWQGAVFKYLTRHPIDVYLTTSVADAERVLARLAKQHGDWTLQEAERHKETTSPHRKPAAGGAAGDCL